MAAVDDFQAAGTKEPMAERPMLAAVTQHYSPTKTASIDAVKLVGITQNIDGNPGRLPRLFGLYPHPRQSTSMLPTVLLLVPVIAALAQAPIEDLQRAKGRNATATQGAEGRVKSLPFGDAPLILATAKGPTQVNLTWPPVAEPGYGYLVEVQSVADSRYASWTELAPIPADPSPSKDVYQPPTNGLPAWVVEKQYLDPGDDSPAQFIATGLLPNTAYRFRARTFRRLVQSDYGKYSNVVETRTAAYVQHYVATGGNDANDGSDASHAWKTLAHATAALTCGQVLIVEPGNYSGFSMGQTCSANARAVVRAPGSSVRSAVSIGGSYIVLDGLVVNQTAAQYGLTVGGSHHALFNVETYSGYGGVGLVRADHALIYHCRLHDAGNPPVDGGQGGFVLALQVSTQNVIWSNHLTRGSHDVSLCKAGCINNRWLNNVMDGGWGMGFEAIESSTGNLIEGNVIWRTGKGITSYKPGIELSSASNTARRNLIAQGASLAVEVSALYGGDTAKGTLIYNNTFVDNDRCLFQSHNGGVAAYDGNVFANNICVGFTLATDIYLANVASQFTNNDFLGSSGDPGAKVVIWAHATPGGFEYPVAVGIADTRYNPPWSHNKATNPRFVDAAGLDFHLHPASPLVGAAVPIVDPAWGRLPPRDLGMFGITGR